MPGRWRVAVCKGDEAFRLLFFLSSDTQLKVDIRQYATRKLQVISRLSFLLEARMSLISKILHPYIIYICVFVIIIAAIGGFSAYKIAYAKGMDAGYESGHKKGYAEGVSDYKKIIEKINEDIKKINESMEKTIREHNDWMKKADKEMHDVLRKFKNDPQANVMCLPSSVADELRASGT